MSHAPDARRAARPREDRTAWRRAPRSHTICCRRSGSPDVIAGRTAMSGSTRSRFAAAAGCTTSTAASTIAARSTGTTCKRSLPVTIRETSSRSSISRACTLALRSMLSSARVCVAGSTRVERRMRAHPSTAFSGVRGSCDTSRGTRPVAGWRRVDRPHPTSAVAKC